MTKRSFRFARNMSWGAVGQFLAAAANLVIIPYLVRSLGNQDYGLYILLFAMAGYLGLASLCASGAAVKFSAACAADNNGRALRDAARYSYVIQAGGAALAAAVALAAAPIFAFRLFHVPPHLRPIATYLLRCAGAGAVFAAVTEASSGLLQGLQRFDLANGIVLMRNVVLPAGAAALVWRGFGLQALGAWYVAVNVVAAAIAYLLAALAIRPFPAHKDHPPLPLADFLRWSLGQWTAGFAWTMTFQFDRLFIARNVSLSGLTLYSVPASLLQRLQVLPGMVVLSALPLMSEARRPGQEEEMRRMYLKSLRFLMWVTLPALTLLAMLMPQFLGLWLGGEFSAHSVLPARLLCAAQVCFMVTSMPTAVVTARHNPWYIPAFQWSQAIVSLLFWRTFVPHWGLPAVGAGALLAQALPGVVYIALVHRQYLHLPLGRYLDEGLTVPFLSAGLVLILLYPVHGLISGWLGLAGAVAAGLAAYYGSTFALLSGEDRALLKDWIKHHLGDGRSLTV